MWAALPPFPAQPAQDPRPITLVTAAIDSTAFFHDLAQVHSPPHRLACSPGHDMTAEVPQGAGLSRGYFCIGQTYK